MTVSSRLLLWGGGYNAAVPQGQYWLSSRLRSHLGACRCRLGVVSSLCWLYCFACGLVAEPAASQTARSLKIVVPLAAGGGADIVARVLAEQIGRAQNVTAVVENRPGAGTVIGTEAVARAAPDGETVMLTNPAFLINPHIKKVGYDPLTSFDPVCNIVNFPLVFVVPANSPLKTMADMLAMARAKPGSVTVASAGTGNPTHIGFEVLKSATGLDMTYVPFAGAAPAVNALLGGHITSVYSDYTTVSAQLKAGDAAGDGGRLAAALRRAARRADAARAGLDRLRSGKLERRAGAGEDAEGHARAARKAGSPRRASRPS